MRYQDELMDAETVALWAGDPDTEGDLNEFLGRPFENDFGFLLDQDALPEYAVKTAAKRLRAWYNESLQRSPVRELLATWSGEDWIAAAERLCRDAGIRETKAVLKFPNLRYPNELLRNANSLLKFVGNVPWPGGRGRFAQLLEARLNAPPFPVLTRRDFADGACFSWGGRVHLESWKGFATEEEMFGEFGAWRFSPWPDGDFGLDVKLPDRRNTVRPSAAQVKAFQHLVDNEETIRDEVLRGIFEVYPKWSDIYGDDDLMPPISGTPELRRLMALGTVFVLEQERDGFTAIGFSFRCKWDQEHGLGVLTHAGKVLEVAQADIAFQDLS